MGTLNMGTVADRFGYDAKSPAELAQRNDEWIAALNDSVHKTERGGVVQSVEGPMMTFKSRDVDASYMDRIASALGPDAMKAISGDVLGALQAQLDQADVTNKEWTTTFPLSTGFVPYDLEAPAKLLAPRPTPWRNMIPRIKGVGTVHRFKTIPGISGSGYYAGYSGTGIGVQFPGIGESTTNNDPAGVARLRGPNITYNATDVTATQIQFSLTDTVSWLAEYAGQGFEDIRSLSNAILLYSSMLAEERLLLYGRGATTGGYVGALTAPSTPTLAAVAASVASTSLAAGVALSYTSNVWVVVAADAGDLGLACGTLGVPHQGPISAQASVNVGAGNVIQVTIGTDVVGALGYNIFAASVNGGPYYWQSRTGYNVGFVQGTMLNATTAGCASVTSGQADNSALTNCYDGLMTNLGSLGGYVNRLNAKFSTTTPGQEFQAAFASLFQSIKADPDAIWMNGLDRVQLSEALQSATQAAPSNYRLQVMQDELTGVYIGTMVSHITNGVRGKSVPIMVHDWMPQGNSTVWSYQVPIPDSNVSNTVAVVALQDYVGVQWPQTQFAYEASSYWVSTVAHYAPAFSAVIEGIQPN